ncbi:hypothetical protein CONPUDRAFT_142357 [Coniophora puteana RWD-64-598 SS2]|uniref:WD40 repeat-like protein n=1 Tax=Coniophora puteana (strain RWD-64-598) TaxID=741705 RepID=A0A5M3MYC0_CONPW|nr:uncharacterized protein CONPUDRAFT_142357 [Coniophora puteana RWD-64-598 SS2]EIW83774.1 hypothetical protein CONPUDRAFT_142357 [Coniophora puteana RWD-64-598 SS2]
MISQRAKGRFIFAATIVRMIDQEQPHERLSLVNSMLRGDVEHVWGNIDHLYASIIDSIEASARENALKFISLLVNLAEPLSLSDLRLLFGVDIYLFLLPFSALVHIPPVDSRDTVQIYHSTLRDFLQHRNQNDSDQDIANRVHHPIAIRCFRTMARMLKHDICGLQDPSLLHVEIHDFAQRRDTIPRAVRYACLYWLHHLEHLLVDSEVRGCLIEFLERRLLFFIEACSVLGELDAAVGLLRAARKHVIGWRTSSFPGFETATSLLYDSWRLVMDFFDAISVSALHVYESALPYAPAKSRIRLTYSHVLSETSCVTIENGLDDRWDCVTRVLDMKTDDFDVSLSPDTSQVATFRMDSEDTGTIMLWDTATGVLITSYLLEGICEPSFDYDDRTDLVHGGSFVAIRDSQRCYLWRPFNQSVSRVEAPQTECFFGPVAVSRNGDRMASLVTSSAAPGKSFSVCVYDTSSLQQISCWSFPLQFKELPLVALDFACKDDCLLVRVWPFSPFLKHSRSYVLVVDSTDGQLLWHGEYDCFNAIFDSSDDIIMARAESTGISLLRRVAPSQNATAAQPASRPKSNPSSPFNGRKLSRELFRSSRKLPLVTCAQGRMYQAVDPKTSSHVFPEFVAEPISHGQVAVRQGDKISAFVRTGSTIKKTRWRPQNVECFGISWEAGPGKGIAQIIDLTQAVAAISFSHEDTEDDPYEWSLALTSRRGDVTAYKSTTNWTRRTKYILVGRGVEPADDAFRCNIVPDALNVAWTSSSDVSTRKTIALSPKSTYFAVSTIRRDKGRIQVWNSRSGALMGSAPAAGLGLEAETVLEMSFAEDETVLVLSCWAYESHSVFIHVYSLEGGTVKHVGSISPPSLICAEPCVIASVTRDAVDYFCADKDHNLVYHFRWNRETSTPVSVSSFPYLGFINADVTHSPSFKRIYYRTPATNTEFILNMKRSAGDETKTYEVEEAESPKAFYDHRSWSDLCVDVDGWLRQRRRRICWLPERYRPAELGESGLELIVEGNQVTILKLHNEKCITIRLLNTEIVFFE